MKSVIGILVLLLGIGCMSDDIEMKNWQREEKLKTYFLLKERLSHPVQYCPPTVSCDPILPPEINCPINPYFSC